MHHTDTSPMGYLASNTIFCNEATPAIVVNPAAAPTDLLAWCAGELRSMEATGTALLEVASDKEALDLSAFSAIFMHRLAPLARVLELALHRLVQAQKQANKTGP